MSHARGPTQFFWGGPRSLTQAPRGWILRRKVQERVRGEERSRRLRKPFTPLRLCWRRPHDSSGKFGLSHCVWGHQDRPHVEVPFPAQDPSGTLALQLPDRLDPGATSHCVQAWHVRQGQGRHGPWTASTTAPGHKVAL